MSVELKFNDYFQPEEDAHCLEPIYKICIDSECQEELTEISNIQLSDKSLVISQGSIMFEESFYIVDTA